MLLVIGCTVMVRTFTRLQRVELGFKPDNVLTFGINLPLRTYEQPAVAAQFWERLEARLNAMPGVDGAALIDQIGTDRGLNINSIRIVGRPDQDDFRLGLTVDMAETAGPGALTVLGARFVKGRDISASDTGTAPRVIVINEAFARKFFPGEDPIGKEVTSYPNRDPKEDKPARIVGVIADIKNQGVDKPAATEIYMPRAQAQTLFEPQISMLLLYGVVRSKDDPAELAPAIQRAVAEIDPAVPVYGVRTMNELQWEAVARPRFFTLILSAFAFVALVLAAVGIYGVMAHTVAQRTHEIGLRVALGAQPKQVRALVLKQAASLVAIGVAIGLGAALALQFALEKPLADMFYGEQMSQPVLLIGVAIAVAATALLATWVPARRATKVEPTVALRSE
jgi:putative ABC transport system permease protein